MLLANNGAIRITALNEVSHFGEQSSEEEDEKFISGDGQPVDDDIDVAGSGAPL